MCKRFATVQMTVTSSPSDVEAAGHAIELSPGGMPTSPTSSVGGRPVADVAVELPDVAVSGRSDERRLCAFALGAEAL